MSDIKDQVFLLIEEINENHAVLREKVLGWTANKVEQEKSSGRAPMDIGEVDDSQSALQSHLDWPGQWQVDEWDINAVGNYCYTSWGSVTRRLMNTTPRNPRWSSGPRMTSTTMTSPSARRSLMRAEDEPITLKKKVCRLVCRRPSVMIERGDPLFAHLTHKFRVFKKFKDTALKVSKLGFFWNDKESRFSLTVKSSRRRTTSTRSSTSS